MTDARRPTRRRPRHATAASIGAFCLPFLVAVVVASSCGRRPDSRAREEEPKTSRAGAPDAPDAASDVEAEPPTERRAPAATAERAEPERRQDTPDDAQGGIPEEAVARPASTAGAPRRFPFVGACLSTMPRHKLVPGRVWLDYDGAETDPLQFMVDNGFNAVRVLAKSDETFATDMRAVREDNRNNYDFRESRFQTEWGGTDLQVDLARRCRNLGMRVVLTIQFGRDKPVEGNWHEFIPDDWLGLTYRQTLEKIDTHTRTMISYYLDAGVQPDVVIVENEADSGIMFQYLDEEGKMACRAGREYALNDAATGHYSVWPKCAGYIKREILSVRDELEKRGLDFARTRFAVHTTCNPFRAQSTFNRIFRNKPDADAVYYEKGEPVGVVEAVPAYLRALRVDDMVDIMGFSHYPPIPKDEPGFPAEKSFRRLAKDLAHFAPTIERYGRHEDGPFQGQYRKQALVIEYATGGQKSSDFGEREQIPHTEEFFRTLARYEWTMGALWWEPTYGNNCWYHHEGSLFRRKTWDKARKIWTEMRPIPALRTWGSFALPRDEVKAPRADAQRLPWLSVDTRRRSVVDADGSTVQLTGFNLGNWLVNEVWMFPLASDTAPAGYDKPTRRIGDHVSLWRVIQERLGEDAMRRVQRKWRTTWITDTDFARMAAAGCNHVRLPFIYDNLLGDDLALADIDTVDPASFPDRSLDFTWLDWTVETAKRHGMYVVIDMHGAPGRQSGEHHTGLGGACRLYDSARARAWSVKLWTAIARRYRDEPAVAGYDLLNEPSAAGRKGRANLDAIHEMHALLYEAVRTVDPRHIVIVEDGFAGCNNLPRPAENGWTNVMLSYHAYPRGNEGLARLTEKTLGSWELKDILLRGSPLYLGEWSLEMGGLSTPDNFRTATRIMKRKGVSWALWSYKIVPKGHTSWRGTHWGWLRPVDEFPPYLDVFEDDEQTLLESIESYRSDRLTVSRAVDAALPKR